MGSVLDAEEGNEDGVDKGTQKEGKVRVFEGMSEDFGKKRKKEC